MNIQLSESHFTNGADLAFVYGVYKKTFEAVLGKIKALCFLSMNWVITEEWKAFCHEVIPQCEKLETLFLSGNPDLAVDIVELVAKLPPTLAKLRLDNTGCFGDATKADWARLPALESVGLIGTKITGTEEAIVAAIAAAGCKAAGNVDRRSTGEQQDLHGLPVCVCVCVCVYFEQQSDMGYGRGPSLEPRPNAFHGVQQSDEVRASLGRRE